MADKAERARAARRARLAVVAKKAEEDAAADTAKAAGTASNAAATSDAVQRARDAAMKARKVGEQVAASAINSSENVADMQAPAAPTSVATVEGSVEQLPPGPDVSAAVASIF